MRAKSHMKQFDEREKELLTNVGSILRELRESKGLTQKDVARHVGSTQANLSYLENAKGDVMLTTLLKWADAYGVDLEVSFVARGEKWDFEQALAEMEEES